MLGKLLSVAIFLSAYALIALLYEKKTLIVFAAVGLLLILKRITPIGAIRSIDWNVVMLYFGMLFVSEVFLFSKMPDFIATRIVSKANRVGMAMLIICLFSGVLSIALENVAVVLLVSPIALSISRKCDINPVPLFIGMAISANLQGAATLIGDPPSMLLAGFARMDFNDFFFFEGHPSIFFAIQAGAIFSGLVLYVLFTKYTTKMPVIPRESYLFLTPTILILFLIGTLVISSSIHHDIEYLTGLVCFVFGLICFIWYLIKNNRKDVKLFLMKLDWQTGIFLIEIFILVESLVVSGITKDVSHFVLRISKGSPFLTYQVIVWMSVLLSAFIDNVPFLAAMLPVIRTITVNMGIDPYPFFFGLLVGASVGGNITPIGASANIVAMGIMRKQGYDVRFFEFVRIGLPFSIVAVLTGSMFIWFFSV